MCRASAVWAISHVPIGLQRFDAAHNGIEPRIPISDENGIQSPRQKFAQSADLAYITFQRKKACRNSLVYFFTIACTIDTVHGFAFEVG